MAALHAHTQHLSFPQNQRRQCMIQGFHKEAAGSSRAEEPPLQHTHRHQSVTSSMTECLHNAIFHRPPTFCSFHILNLSCASSSYSYRPMLPRDDTSRISTKYNPTPSPSRQVTRPNTQHRDAPDQVPGDGPAVWLGAWLMAPLIITYSATLITPLN